MTSLQITIQLALFDHQNMGNWSFYTPSLMAENTWGFPRNVSIPKKNPKDLIFFVGTPLGRQGWSKLSFHELAFEVGNNFFPLGGQKNGWYKKKHPTGMSCRYLVAGWFHPYISRLFTSLK